MARVHGKDISTLTLNSVNLLADTKELNFEVTAATHDTTTIGDDWFEATAGLKGGDEISHVLMYDNTNTTGNWVVLTGLLGGSAVTLAVSDGTRTISASVVVTGLSLPINVGEMLQVTATYKLTGTVTFS